MKKIENNLKIAFEKIQTANHILITTHERPDGDALSSMCAMIEYVQSLNKKYLAYCFHNTPDNYKYLPNILNIKQKIDNDFSVFDLIIILDCGSPERTKIQTQIANRKNNQYVIEFDHHPKIVDYANLEIRNTKAVSTTEIIYDFLKYNNIPMNKNFANCILTGILTDTGNFLYPITSDKAVSITSEMLIYGARFPEIIKNTWYNKSLETMKLWGKALNNLRINKKYNVAFSVLTKDDINILEKDDNRFDAIASFLCNLHGVKALLFLREEEGDSIKGSLRSSHPKIDISKLAKILGGGGHPKASGFVINGQIINKTGKWKIT